ncbi:MAG: hypothetical protein ACRDH7_00470 [Actinomycetota bacterium]
MLGRADAWTSLSLADYLPRRFPPEPFRPVSARIVNRAVVEKDRQQERSPASSWVIDQVAQLPTRMGYKLPPG